MPVGAGIALSAAGAAGVALPAVLGGATLGTGAILGGTALAGAGLSSKAAKSAAATQAAAAGRAGEQQTALGREALAYQQGIDTRTYGDLAPYREVGSSALPGLSRLLGYGPGGSAGIQTELESLPGYQFARDQGVKAVNNSIGSRGLTGAQAKGISRFVTGLADQTYGSQVDRYSRAADMGAGAVGAGGNVGVQTANSAGGTLGGIGQAISDAIIGAANASAGGTVGSANALGGAATGLGNAYLASKILGGNGGGGLYGSPKADTGGSVWRGIR